LCWDCLSDGNTAWFVCTTRDLSLPRVTKLQNLVQAVMELKLDCKETTHEPDTLLLLICGHKGRL
jgi:hypothetical protein